MHTLVFAATKGGVGKTTIAANVAVRAAQASQRVALIDFDRQGSLKLWWKLRGSPENPALFDNVGNLDDSIERLSQAGYDWLIIDTPPQFLEIIENAIEHASIVIVPLGHSTFDVGSMPAVVGLNVADRPLRLLLNKIEPRWKLNETVNDKLTGAGYELLPSISYRQAYMSSTSLGKSGPEVEKNSTACADEIDALWAAINEALGVRAKKSKAGAGRV